MVKNHLSALTTIDKYFLIFTSKKDIIIQCISFSRCYFFFLGIFFVYIPLVMIKAKEWCGTFEIEFQTYWDQLNRSDSLSFFFLFFICLCTTCDFLRTCAVKVIKVQIFSNFVINNFFLLFFF